MQLNSDCVRTLLLTIEECGYGEHLRTHILYEKLPEYSHEDISYACLKLDEAGYLDVLTTRSLGSTMPIIVEVRDITYAGHEFLNAIRESKNWLKIKDTAKKAGVFSLKHLAQIGEAVATAAIQSALQGH